jgi:hypothetical protein
MVGYGMMGGRVPAVPGDSADRRESSHGVEQAGGNLALHACQGHTRTLASTAPTGHKESSQAKIRNKVMGL